MVPQHNERTSDGGRGRRKKLTCSETSLGDGEQLWPVRPAQASSEAEREAEERARSESRMERADRTCEGAAQDLRCQATVKDPVVISLLQSKPIHQRLG